MKSQHCHQGRGIYYVPTALPGGIRQRLLGAAVSARHEPAGLMTVKDERLIISLVAA